MARHPSLLSGIAAALTIACSATALSHPHRPPASPLPRPEQGRAAAPADGAAWPQPPAALYGPLFREVQLQRVFADSKTFADLRALAPPHRIVADYRRSRTAPDFSPTAFVAAHFAPPRRAGRPLRADPRQDVHAHIDALWAGLVRPPGMSGPPYDSLLPVPSPYVAADSRSDELTYWNSYFAMLGLEQAGRHAEAVAQLDDVAALIDRYGHMPAANRSYDLSRSQPPFFSLMVDVVAAHDGPRVYTRYLPELEVEYAYWMDGAASLTSGSAQRRVVRLPDGTVMNRYWDDRSAPRDDAYREDVVFARRARRPAAEIWRELRAADESGWGTGSRWLADVRDPSSLRVTALLPVDLNALMVHLEATLAKAYRLDGDRARAENLQLRAEQRSAAIRRLMWNAGRGAFTDYDWKAGAPTHRLTAATVFPLFLGLARAEQAHAVAQTLHRELLQPGGLALTRTVTGQPWDAPYGAAPLQYLAVVGLASYGEAALAATIAHRWIRCNLRQYEANGRLYARYDVSGGPPVAAANPPPDGSAWTAGVLSVLLALYPQTTEERTTETRPATR